MDKIISLFRFKKDMAVLAEERILCAFDTKMNSEIPGVTADAKRKILRKALKLQLVSCLFFIKPKDS